MQEEKQGYVYILTNPSFREDWVKIGKTRNLEDRLKTLDNTSIPLPFEVFATMKTAKYNEAEKLVHSYIQRFTNLRIRDNREFFNVKPEIALEIFKEIALVIEDAEINEVYKTTVSGHGEKSCKKEHRVAGEKRVWLIPSNSKYFDLQGCFDKYGYVYWTQHFNFQKGDTGYIYSSSPDSAIRYRFEVVETELQYNDDVEKQAEFFVDRADNEVTRQYNRFFKIKETGRTSTNRLSLVNLMDNGLKTAPRGALNLSYKGYEDLKNYIEKNF